MYYRGATASVVAFDVTNRESFEGAKSWVSELQRRGDPNVIIALAGNKTDLKEHRLVSAEEATAYAKANGIIYMDTSAKTGQNVRELFLSIARKLPIQQRQRDAEIVGDLREGGADGDGSKAGKKGCC
jgi:Ras-related protein Rab-5C